MAGGCPKYKGPVQGVGDSTEVNNIADGEDTQRRSLIRVGLIVTLVSSIAVAIVLGILSDAMNCYYRLRGLSPSMGWVYLCSVAVAFAIAGILLVKAFQRYYQVCKVSKLRELIELDGTARGSYPEYDRQVRDGIIKYLQALDGGGRSEIKGAVKKLLAKYDEYGSHAADDIRGLEEFVLAELDGQVDQRIKQTATEVGIATAVGPRWLDSVVVIWGCARLINDISRTYFGRPGGAGTVRILLHAMGLVGFTQVAGRFSEDVTSAISSGLMAKVGRRLAEGVANGYFLAKFGKAVKNVCRPVPEMSRATERFEEV